MALIVAGVMLAGLFAGLIVTARRRDRADRRRLGLDLPSRPDPVLVDRPFDPALCAFCDEASTHRCRACTRPMCGEHRPWLQHLFCYPCEAEWQRGARQRALIITPIVIVSMLLVGAAIGGAALVLARGAGRLALLAFIAPLAVAAPLYALIERRLRARFRPAGNLPRAAQR